MATELLAHPLVKLLIFLYIVIGEKLFLTNKKHFYFIFLIFNCAYLFAVAGLAILPLINLPSGNRHVLLLPLQKTDLELHHTGDHLPENVTVEEVDERHSPLGNIVACYHDVALMHPQLDRDTGGVLV